MKVLENANFPLEVGWCSSIYLSSLRSINLHETFTQPILLNCLVRDVTRSRAFFLTIANRVILEEPSAYFEEGKNRKKSFNNPESQYRFSAANTKNGNLLSFNISNFSKECFTPCGLKQKLRYVNMFLSLVFRLPEGKFNWNF